MNENDELLFKVTHVNSEKENPRRLLSFILVFIIITWESVDNHGNQSKTVEEEKGTKTLR